VWYNYPSRHNTTTRVQPTHFAEQAFHALSNVCMTPHTSALVEEAARESLRCAALARVLCAIAAAADDDHAAVPWPVDTTLGY
jgi:phosphoglycerate dehydrogenase-like enzyme